jgi:hypothetical protein
LCPKKAHRTIKPIFSSGPPQQRADASLPKNTSDFFVGFTDNLGKIIILAAQIFDGGITHRYLPGLFIRPMRSTPVFPSRLFTGRIASQPIRMLR